MAKGQRLYLSRVLSVSSIYYIAAAIRYGAGILCILAAFDNPAMTIMTGSIDMEAFKQRLLTLQTELLALKAIGEEAASVVVLDQSSVGRLSRMDALQGQAMAVARGRRRELELKKIAAALQRIETSNYGLCLACDEPIAPQRLEFDPAVICCIACASKRESGPSSV